jgi:hypothetical protein
MAYTVGDVLTFSIKFRKKDTKALINPTAWEVQLKHPDGTEETLQFGVDIRLTQVTSPGVFLYRQPTSAANDDDAGRWQGWVVSTGTGQASKQFMALVDRSPIPP